MPKTQFDKFAPAPRFARTQPPDLRRLPWAPEPQDTPAGDIAIIIASLAAALLLALDWIK